MLHDQRFMTPVFQGIWIKPGVELSDFTAFLEIDQARSLEGQFLKIIRLWEQADCHKNGKPKRLSLRLFLQVAGGTIIP